MEECLQVTKELADKVQEYLTSNNISIKYKVWVDAEDRNLGIPFTASASQNLYDAIENMTVSYDSGGCIEIVTDNDAEDCIYHLDDYGGEYIYALTLREWGIPY